MKFELEYDDGKTANMLRAAFDRAGDYRKPLGLFRNYMRNETVKLFMANALGGTFRGVRWPYFHPGYIGQQRPSGAIVKQGDAVLQDTRRLLRSVTSNLAISEEHPTEITWGTNLPYAAEQHERRPFLFFTPDDARELERLILKHLQGDS